MIWYQGVEWAPSFQSVGQRCLIAQSVHAVERLDSSLVPVRFISLFLVFTVLVSPPHLPTRFSFEDPPHQFILFYRTI